MSTQAYSSSANYRMQVLHTLRGHEAVWDALVAQCAPNQVLLTDAQGTPCAAAPLYLKQHSYGEYVFDHAWADAYARHGLAYYPKLLCALPFTPVPGTRLIARDDAARTALAQALVVRAQALDASSCHVLFPDPASAQALAQVGWLKRSGVQFHWQNKGYASFDAFLQSLEQKKRKNIRAERRKVQEARIRFEVKDGHSATDDDWAFFTHCYNTTYTQHWSSPYLNLKFFKLLAKHAPAATVLFIAQRDDAPVAASLCIRSGDRLYGRYWGAVEHIPCLHFEACYYQPIEYAIAQGLAVFEGGAQGEHKIARGLAPTPTCSYHWLAEPAFADAIDRYLQRERSGVDAYLDELNERLPFKAVTGDK